ncbi:hypothetical protein CHUAL_006419 [Chamberlinius hualienensis]
MPTKAELSFFLSYNVPDGSFGSWQAMDTDFSIRDSDDEKALLDIEKNIENLERRLSEKCGIISDTYNAPSGVVNAANNTVKQNVISSSGRRLSRKRLASVMKLGKQRPTADINDERRLLNETTEITEYGSMAAQTERHYNDVIQTPRLSIEDEKIMQRLSVTEADDVSKNANQRSNSNSSKCKWQPNEVPAELKVQDYQVCVTVIEARQLAGLNMDPVVCIEVGDQKKHTSVKESTNCPYYNEYFVFDFQMPSAVLFDKMITLSVLYSRNLIRTGTVLGSFKMDVGTVWSQRDKQFFHKWAILTDPQDPIGIPKGYIKCDISVIGKGDTIKIPQKSAKDEDDIEENLLLPDGFPAERQRARYIIRIYKADGLPRMNAGIMANVKKAFTGEVQDLVDPYVQATFAGATGKTSVKKNSYAPVWNEQIVFTDMFPPLCQRIKIQLRDNDSVNESVIGTHYIELSKISNDGEKGFLPTFGPTFIHLYGSTRDFSIFQEHTNLNEGLGEGVSYRGRIFLAIKTELIDANDNTCYPDVTVEPTLPVLETTFGRYEEFVLFGVIFDADMIDRRIGDKPIYFEMSIGNAGNALDGVMNTISGGSRGNQSNGNAQSSTTDVDDVNERLTNEAEANLHIVKCLDSPKWQSTTIPMRPISRDRVYFSIPYDDVKPCVYVYSNWQDCRWRLYNSNEINRIADHLEENLSELLTLVEQDKTTIEKHMKETLEDLLSETNRYFKHSKSSSSAVKNKLDKERERLCQRELKNLLSKARLMLGVVVPRTVKDHLKTLKQILKRLRYLAEEPQHCIPDVFLWMISGGKRVAYYRIPASNVIYSNNQYECGKDCGKLNTIFLKLPGKRGVGQTGWTVQAKLRFYVWLGLLTHKQYCVEHLPNGYDVTVDATVKNTAALPPTHIRYKEHSQFQLRAHLYEARSLMASDSSGFSDPFARVIISDQSQTTQVIDETLSPTWDEMLVFHDVVIYGNKTSIKANPPTLIVEVYDQDKVGKAEFMGRMLASPRVKMSEDQYVCPKLEWHELYRGCHPAGELLAAFELIETGAHGTPGDDVPSYPEPKNPAYNMTDTGPCLPVPHNIRPVLSPHRIEILFWGLRDLKRVHLMSVNRPRVDIECAGRILQSSVILNCKKNPNFSTPVKYFDVELPEEPLYCPSLTIRVVDCRSFGRYTLVGSHVINSLHKYLFKPITKRERESIDRKKSLLQLAGNTDQSPTIFANDNADVIVPLEAVCNDVDNDGVPLNSKAAKTNSNRKKKVEMTEVEEDEENKDWWSKYFASIEIMIQEKNKEEVYKDDVISHQNGCPLNQTEESRKDNLLSASNITISSVDRKRTFRGTAVAARFAARISPKHHKKKVGKKQALMKIYPNELESQAEFGYFREWLQTFELYRGKKTGNDEVTDNASNCDENRIVGKFKGFLQVYKIPLPPDMEEAPKNISGDSNMVLFHGLPNNDPIHVLVRVYVIKANDLHPMDINGKADPYLIISLGSKKVNDKENYISKQLNPVFGKCFEFEATFPHDSLLTVQLYDWDLVGSDDLIGETKIDLESRFYSKHRATCGLAQRYETFGYNSWRDAMKPTQVLAKLCKDNHLGVPLYKDNCVRVANKNFVLQQRSDGSYVRVSDEQLALAVLHLWTNIPKVGCSLVPEHVETRPLYNPSKPGIEQGKIEMWVDMFPMDMPLPGPPIDISPRRPKSYELRIIVWNTDEVLLEDDAFFSGEKMSDIYVKGWIKGPEDTQTTDIHYRSLTGEGNFNWRFIFPFEYLVAEEKIVISRKESLFSWDETESKIPARLVLQVWDADHFSADDFLGSITLDLNRFPRGAKSAKLCTLDMLKTDGSVPMISLFKQRRVKGWWPFYAKNNNDEMELTGKVEAEFHLLTEEEAEKSPAGLGRNEPDPLDKPNRPDSSFIWFLNPLKSIRYIIWHNYKWVILKAVLLFLLFAIILLFFYSVPGYTVKKMLGA